MQCKCQFEHSIIQATNNADMALYFEDSVMIIMIYVKSLLLYYITWLILNSANIRKTDFHVPLVILIVFV